MAQIIWEDTKNTYRATLPKGISKIEELENSPIFKETSYIIIPDGHPAIYDTLQQLIINYEKQTITIGEPINPIITVEDVIAERERRFSLGFNYDFGDERGKHHIGTTEEDMKGWDEVDKAASAMLATGIDMPLTIVTNTGPVQISPIEWKQIILAATAHRQPIWQGSFYLQTLNPIPQNFKEDMWWKS